jgi:hypothetical protein
MARIKQAYNQLILLVLEHPEVELNDIDGMTFQDSVEADHQHAVELAVLYPEVPAVSETDRSAAYLDAIDELRTIEENFKSYREAIGAMLESDSQEDEKKKQRIVLEGSLPKGKRNFRRAKKSTTLEVGKVGVTPSEESARTETGEEIVEKVAKLKLLVERWKELRADFHWDRFLEEMKKGWEGDTLPMSKAGEWLKSDTDPNKWNTEKRAFFVENVLRPMEEWVARAETVAKDSREKAKKVSAARKKRKTTADKLVSKEKEPQSVVAKAKARENETRAVALDPAADQPVVSPVATESSVAQADAQAEPAAPDLSDPAIAPLPARDQAVLPDPVEPEPKTNVREIRTGRPITDLGDLTEWERMDISKQNEYRHELRALKVEYLKEMWEELQAIGVDPADMMEGIAQSLRQYLSEAIRTKIPDIELTASDTETLVAELIAEESLIKPE